MRTQLANFLRIPADWNANGNADQGIDLIGPAGQRAHLPPRKSDFLAKEWQLAAAAAIHRFTNPKTPPMKPHTIWTRRITPRIDYKTIHHLDFPQDILLDQRWIGATGPDHNVLQLGTSNGPRQYTIR